MKKFKNWWNRLFSKSEPPKIEAAPPLQSLAFHISHWEEVTGKNFVEEYPEAFDDISDSRRKRFSQAAFLN